MGRALVEVLREEGHRVCEIRSRNVLDLRVAGQLNRFVNESMSFAYVLAAEVGGGQGPFSSHALLPEASFSWLLVLMPRISHIPQYSYCSSLPQSVFCTCSQQGAYMTPC